MMFNRLQLDYMYKLERCQLFVERKRYLTLNQSEWLFFNFEKFSSITVRLVFFSSHEREDIRRVRGRYRFFLDEITGNVS